MTEDRILYKFNDNHDPSNGQFSSGGGGAGATSAGGDLPEDSHEQAQFFAARRARMEQDAKDQAAYADTLEGKRDAARREANKYDAIAADSGLSLSQEQARARAYSVAQHLDRQVLDEDNAQFLRSWTPEQTVARRAAWNAGIKSGAVTGTNGKVNSQKLVAFETKMGFNVDDLKRAVTLHGLGGSSK